MGDWSEDLHPRADGGKFGVGAGGTKPPAKTGPAKPRAKKAAGPAGTAGDPPAPKVAAGAKLSKSTARIAVARAAAKVKAKEVVAKAKARAKELVVTARTKAAGVKPGKTKTATKAKQKEIVDKAKAKASGILAKAKEKSMAIKTKAAGGPVQPAEAPKPATASASSPASPVAKAILAKAAGAPPKAPAAAKPAAPVESPKMPIASASEPKATQSPADVFAKNGLKPSWDAGRNEIKLSIYSGGGGGQLLVKRMDDGKFHISHTSIDQGLRGKGVGKALYQEMNEHLLKEHGQPLMSDYSRSDDAEHVWHSLSKAGLAEGVFEGDNAKHGDPRPDYWQMKMPAVAAPAIPASLARSRARAIVANARQGAPAL